MLMYLRVEAGATIFRALGVIGRMSARKPARGSVPEGVVWTRRSASETCWWLRLVEDKGVGGDGDVHRRL